MVENHLRRLEWQTTNKRREESPETPFEKDETVKEWLKGDVTNVPRNYNRGESADLILLSFYESSTECKVCSVIEGLLGGRTVWEDGRCKGRELVTLDRLLLHRARVAGSASLRHWMKQTWGRQDSCWRPVSSTCLYFFLQLRNNRSNTRK